MDGRHRQGPDGGRGPPQLVGQDHGGIRQLPDQVGGGGQLGLSGPVVELGVPHRHLEAAGVQPGPTQAGGHRVCQHRDAAPDLRPRGEVLE